MIHDVSVDLAKPPAYERPKPGTLRAFLHHCRMRLSYRHYKMMLQRYCAIGRNSVKAILDIGCGPGYLLEILEQSFPKCDFTGIDLDPRLLHTTSQWSRARLIQGNAEELPFRDAEFDVILGLHIVEHLYRPEQSIDEVCRCLKRGGVFIPATPNPEGIGAYVMGHKWKGWSQRHVSLKRPGEWAKLLRERGFTPLLERTTLLSDIPAFRRFPLVMLNWGLLLLFGSFPWKRGEAYIAVWRKD